MVRITGGPARKARGSRGSVASNADPIKIINGYGWAICGQMSLMLLAIYKRLG